MKTIELFAGIGGFRLGLSRSSNQFDFVWANQWEPNSKVQHAWQIYEKNYGKNSCVNKDINEIKVEEIPNFDLLTGGFPCQDYSVAKPLSLSKGMEGKKGVLWWNIKEIIAQKNPKYILLENVDRLLVSPKDKKGRDFSVILKTLIDLGYVVEWKVINAADYGFPQKRKRIFIFAIKNNLEYAEKIKNDISYGIIEKSFNTKIIEKEEFNLTIDNKIDYKKNGIAYDNKVIMYTATPIYSGASIVLKDVLVKEHEVDENFWINNSLLKKWQDCKAKKKIKKIHKNGYEYFYSQGEMSFPDNIDKPARTIITSEGGITPTRTKHIIEQNKKYRRLVPKEIERLFMFSDNYTEGVSDTKRAFLLGNALVVGIIDKLGKEMIKLEGG